MHVLQYGRIVETTDRARPICILNSTARPYCESQRLVLSTSQGRIFRPFPPPRQPHLHTPLQPSMRLLSAKSRTRLPPCMIRSAKRSNINSTHSRASTVQYQVRRPGWRRTCWIPYNAVTKVFGLPAYAQVLVMHACHVTM